MFLSLLLVACGVAYMDDVPTNTDASSGGTYGNLPGYSGGSSADTDTDVDTDSDTDADSGNGGDDTAVDTADTGTGDTDTDSGADTGTEDSAADTGSDELTATFVVKADAHWESSLSYSGCPTVYLLDPANVSRGETLTGSVVDSDGSCGYVESTVTYTPGETFSLEAYWNDGFSYKYLAEFGGLLRVDAVYLKYADNCYGKFDVDASASSTGGGWAYWHVNGDGSGGELYAHTPSATTCDVTSI